MTLVAIVLTPFVVALVAPWLANRGGRVGSWLLALVPAGLAAWMLMQSGQVLAGSPVQFSYPWVSGLGVALAFRMDGLGLLFALLISGIGALIVLYTGYYLAGKPRLGRFQSYTLLFMGSMLGVVLADDVITLFVFWELTSVTSYLLIGFDYENERGRYGALKALLITGAGGLALLLGLVLMGQAGGSLQLSELLARGETLRASALYLPMLMMVLIGAFTKSAQAPFHIWLPDAMQAPTPASAYLHSATMVKAGVYLLARLHPALGGVEVWQYSVGLVGLGTLLLGAYLAFKQTDLKALLAYSTISSLGLMVALIGLGSPIALKAAVVTVLAHAFYKAALFLLVGIVDHETGSRDLRQLGGLARAMPASAGLAILAALSMAGIPPLFGFIAKEKFLEAVLQVEGGQVLIGLAPPVAVLAAVFGVAYSILIVYGVFFGERRPTPRPAHEAPAGMLLAPGLLVLLSLMVVWPPLQGGAAGLLAAAAGSALGAATDIDLGLWHGVNLPLVLSVAAVLGGALVFARRDWMWDLQSRWPQGWRVDALYDGGLEALNRAAVALTRTVQTGTLRHYLMMILGTLLLLVSYALVIAGDFQWPGGFSFQDIRSYEIAAAGLMIVAVLVVVVMTSRLGAIAALGTVGFLMALFYVTYSGPDLALTQLLVETLTVILLLLVFYFLPRLFEDRSPKLARLRDVILAAGMGALVSLLVMLVVPLNLQENLSQQAQLALTIPEFYVEKSLVEAYGANVVNVILVDFRALDTLGEITVLVIAALGVIGMIKLRPRPTPGLAEAGRKEEAE